MLCKHEVIGSNPIISILLFMLILILLFPFLGFLGGSLFGRLSGAGVAYTTTIFTFISFLLSANVLLEIIKIGNVYTLNLFQ